MADVLYRNSGSIAWITINRPPLNPIRERTWREFGEALDRAAADASVRVVAVTGAGDRAFSVGADLKEMPVDLSPVQSLSEARDLQELLRRLEQYPKPTIAAVHGYALGGGFELALACTLRIVADNARCSIPEVNLGLVPALGACRRLLRLIGPAWTAELVLTGRMIDAEEAYRMGIANQVTSPSNLESSVEEFARLLVDKSPTVLSLAMAALQANQEASSAAGDLLTSALFAISMQTRESSQARQRMREKLG